MSAHNRLDEHQRRAVEAPVGPVAILAGPGSGKTATLVARIERLVRQGEIDPARTLALCHTTKAAGELRGRLVGGAGSLVTCSTIHAVAWRQIRRLWVDWGRTGEPQLVASTHRLVRRAGEAALRRRLEASEVSDLASEIDWARACRVGRERYRAEVAARGRVVAAGVGDVVAVWASYEALKAAEDLVDFADVVELAAEMAEEDSPLGELVRSRVDAVFVDEYQDVDAAQQRLIDAWLAGSGRITCVGDRDQAVFCFKGGDPAFLEGFAARWRGAVVVELVRNYRSSPEVVGWVNRLASPGRSPLVGQAAAGPAPRVLGVVDESSEERALVQQLSRWHDQGIAWEEMAVLYRFNAASARVESALLDAGIPHFVGGSVRFFDRAEVREVLVPFGRAARVDPDADGLEVLEAAAAETGFDPAVVPAGAGLARQRHDAVAALFALAGDSMCGWSAGAMLEEFLVRARESHELTPGGVSISTIHAAKGLEWDAVWVLGAVEGQLPSSFAKTPAAILEEQRLVYVATSRARRHLVLSWAERRHNGWSDRPSRFLDLLGDGGGVRRHRRGGRGGAAPGVAGGERLGRVGECERCGGRLTSAEARRARRCSLGCLEGEAAGRAQLLVSWRRDEATRLGVTEDQVARDRALLRASIAGSSCGIAGFSCAAAQPPPI